MDQEIFALIGGSFRNKTPNNSKVSNGQLLGEIIQYGTATPVHAHCDGDISWVRTDGIIPQNERLYVIAATVIAAPPVLAAVAQPQPAVASAGSATSASSAPASPANPATPAQQSIAAATPAPASAKNVRKPRRGARGSDTRPDSDKA